MDHQVHVAGQQLIRHPPPAQLFGNLQWPLATLAPAAHESLHETFIREQSLGLQLVEHLLQQPGIGPGTGEFASQLGTAVLPPRQQVHGPAAQGGPLAAQAWASSPPGTGSASSGSTWGRTLARISASMRSAMSGLSLRNWRTFSLPWPMRSPW